MARIFENRAAAGIALAKELKHYKRIDNGLVLAVNGTSAPAAVKVAHELHLYMDLILARHLVMPGGKGQILGAVTLDGSCFINTHVKNSASVLDPIASRISKIELSKLKTEDAHIRQGRAPLPIKGKTIILVCDGINTGNIINAVILSLKNQMPEKIVVATPAASIKSLDSIRRMVDETICMSLPNPFKGVAESYNSYVPMSDRELDFWLQQAWNSEHSDMLESKKAAELNPGGTLVNPPLVPKHKISSLQWKSFFSAFSEQHFNWLVSVREPVYRKLTTGKVLTLGHVRKYVDRKPLVSVSYDEASLCILLSFLENDKIRLMKIKAPNEIRCKTVHFNRKDIYIEAESNKTLRLNFLKKALTSYKVVDNKCIINE